MSELKGIRRCDSCGETYPAYGPYSEYRTCIVCGGTLIDYERRAPDPRVVALVDATELFRCKVGYSQTWSVEWDLLKAALTALKEESR